MPRKPRVLTDSGVYHIITRGNNRQALFRKLEDYKTFLNLLRLAKTEYGFEIYHYCLMTNHVHLLIKFYNQEGLQKAMQRVNLTYAKYYKRNYKYHGHVFQDRFKSLPIDKDSYLLDCGRYIERNPLNAKMVSNLSEYIWSSYHFYADGASNALLSQNPFYNDLGQTDEERRNRYREYLSVARPYEELIRDGLLRT